MKGKLVTSTREFFVQFADKTSGPFSLEQLQKLVARGRLTADHQVRESNQDWQPAGRLQELDFQAAGTAEGISVAAYCLNCRAPLEPTAGKCPRCGVRIGQRTEEPVNEFDDLFSSIQDAAWDTKGEGHRFAWWLNITSGFTGLLFSAPLVIFGLTTGRLRSGTAIGMLLVGSFGIGALLGVCLLMMFAPTAMLRSPVGLKLQRIFFGIENPVISRCIYGFLGLLGLFLVGWFLVAWFLASRQLN